MREPLRSDRAYSTRSGHIVVGWEHHAGTDDFPIRARLMGRDGRVTVQFFTDDGRWSIAQDSELDLVAMPPSERLA